MFNKLVLIGLAFMSGYALAGVLINLAAGIEPLVFDVLVLIMTVISLVIILGISWWERRR